MCVGRGCVSKDTCYRHTAKPNEYWQSEMKFYENLFVGEDGKTRCDDYIEDFLLKKRGKNE